MEDDGPIIDEKDGPVGAITRKAPKKRASDQPAPPPRDLANDPTRSMPWDSDAEKGVLSCFLCDPRNLLPDAKVSLPEEAFYHPAHQIIYKTMQQFSEDGKRPVEYIALTGYFREADLLEKIGGPGALSELLNFVPTPAHYPYYKKTLKVKLRMRETIKACTEGLEKCYEYQEEDDALSLPGRIADNLAKLEDGDADRIVSFNEYVGEAIERYQDSMEGGGKMNGYSTGFPLIDKLTGGMQRAHNWVIGGGTSDGKTALAMNMMRNLARQGIPCSYHYGEMKAGEFVDRFFSAEAEVPSDEFLRGLQYPDDIKKLSKASMSLGKLPIFMREARGWTDAQICSDIRRLARSKGVVVSFVDYVQKFRCSNKNAKTREQEVASMSQNYTTVSGEKHANVCMVLLSQLNAEGKLRESESLGFDSDRALMIRKKMDAKKKSIEHRRQIDFPKIRGGKRFVHVDMDFHGQIFTFKESAEQTDPNI